MKIPLKTLKSGFSLPVYGLGTWEMGGRMEPDYSKDEAQIQAIKNAIEHGITHIDTAEMYGAGHAEELIAEAIKVYDRSKLFITSKVIGFNQSYENVLHSCEESLKRLGTEYLDLYLLHRFPDPGLDIKETMRAMDKLVADGKVKHIGVSNFTVPRLKAAQECTTNKIVCNQVHYSLEYREIVEKGVLEYCQENDIFIVAWGPLSKGALEDAEILHKMAEKYHKTPYQVALNWVLAQKNVITIPKTTSLEHLKENLGSIGWEMDPDDIDKLTKEFPNQKVVSNRVPLDYPASMEA
ncbi:MAG: hypothetical protein JWO47_344 [Candidatus Saccharibacteria bacterium]|nr:hypothetical protein [Candidatus Saccharibacteria bacterium]